MNRCVCYWNLIRCQQPNIQVRLQQTELCSFGCQSSLGEAVWLACPLEDKDLETRLTVFLP